jgi:SAM-dependent methyltransferase
MTAALKWAQALAAWAIPPEILEQAPENPWGFPVEPFAGSTEPAPSHRRAAEVLAAGGTVLDVGAGGGSMAVGLDAEVTAVDSQPTMLDVNPAANKILGSWPEEADKAPVADVVLCGHVFYNVPQLVPFVEALTEHARNRVVTEMTAAHPLVAMNGLWQRFWGVERPTGPTWQDAVAVLDEVGITAHAEEWERRARIGFHHFEHLVAFTRRRLCLPAERDDDVAEALRETAAERDGRWFATAHLGRGVTIWWDR